MKKSTTSKYLEQIKDKNLDNSSEQLSSINIKPSESSSALLEVLSKINKKTPSLVVRENLSFCLAQAILRSTKDAESLRKAVQRFLETNTFPAEESAISYLIKAGVIKLNVKDIPNFLAKKTD